MMYNYSYEMASFIIMCLLMIHFLTYRQFPLKRTRLFFLFLVGCVINSGIALLLAFSYRSGMEIPLWIRYCLVLAFYGFQDFNYYMFYYFSLYCCELPRKERHKLAFAGALPGLCFGILLLATPFTKWLFYFDEAGIMKRGDAYFCAEVNITAYLLMEIVILILGNRRIRKYTKIVFVIYTCSAFTGLIIQSMRQTLLLDGFIRMIILLLLYFSLQNMGEMTDYTSKLGNRKALKSIIKSCMDMNKRMVIIYVHIRKMNFLRMTMGNKSSHELTELLGDFFRECGSKYYSFRVETNDFAIFIPKNMQMVGVKVEEIKERFRKEWQLDNMELKLTPEIIIFDYPEHFENIEELWGMRDYMLKYLEERKQGNVLFADKELMRAYYKEIRVDHALDEAARNKSIEVEYQPIYSIEKGCVIAAEALARLRDEEGNYISPMEFIPLAEKSNMIVELGYIIFEKVCVFIQNDILPHPELGIEKIHVNLSAIQCIQQDMADHFIELMEQYEIPPNMIEFEVTETITLTFTSLMIEHMEKLLQTGCHFSLDDYGTGSSNCAYLIDYSFRTVKFDKEMTQAYFHSDTANVIIGNEIETVNRLGLDIVAEGVETEEEYRSLCQTKVNYIQGYYFSKPLKGTEFIRYLTLSRKDSVSAE